MTMYDLYLESGPMHKKTMVHVLSLPGCIANGPTTEAAVEATPEAIRAYLWFLKRHGESVQADGEIRTRVAEHFDRPAVFIGQGSPYIDFGPDLEPMTPGEVREATARFHYMRETLAEWAESQTEEQLSAPPRGGGRTARSIVLHVLNGSGYLTPVLGTFKGLSSLDRAVERGELSLAEAVRKVDAAVAERLPAATAEQRRAVMQRENHVRTLRKGVRRLLEHDWEHLYELARRPGGPVL